MKKRDLEQVLVREGWFKVRSGKHEIWQKRDVHVAVPHSKEISEYTAKDILKKVRVLKDK